MTCSNECASVLKASHLNTSESHAKAEETLLQRYGVKYPAQHQEFLDKQKATTKQRYGVEYFAQSENYKETAIATNQKKYGVDWAIQSNEIKDKRRESVRDKYGVDNVMELAEVKVKIRTNYRNATGYDSPLQNPEVRDKGKDTLLQKFGVDSYSKTEQFKEQFKQTMNDRYGADNPLKVSEIKDKVFATNLERYGSHCYLSSEEGKRNAQEQFRKKYGVDHYLELPEWKVNHVIDPTKIDEWMKFLDDPESYLSQLDRPSYRELQKILGVSDSTVGYYVNKFNLQHLVRYTLSYMEDEVVEFIRSIYNQEIVQHDRQSIKPNELDISLPNKKISIECNPTATHNSSFPFIDATSAPMIPSYHQGKTDICESNGIFVFHIFGYEWTHKREIIESMIRNLVNGNVRKVYARRCEIREVSSNDAYIFLEKNHRQGGVHSKIRLGLYEGGTLVSLMTFGKMRSTIGTGKDDLSECWELVRFCNSLNTSVVGGASKLFKYFIREYSPIRIRSFSDRAHTRGTLYSTLGFEEVRRSEPNYVWVDMKTDKAYHRVNAQKQNIKKFLGDDSIDLSKSEREIMTEHGFVRVYDSGTITWEWTL